MKPQTDPASTLAIFRPELVTLLQQGYTRRTRNKTSRENAAYNLDRVVEKGLVNLYPGQPGYYEYPTPETLNLILEGWSRLAYGTLERPPMTLTRAQYYLGTYRLFREANPLPDGWTDDTSSLEAFIQRGEWAEGLRGFRFRNGTRKVQIDVDQVGDLEVHFHDYEGRGFATQEIFDLLAELIGSYPNAADELENYREMDVDFPDPPCPGKAWNDFLLIGDDVFNR